jgi:hypothetical protein
MVVGSIAVSARTRSSRHLVREVQALLRADRDHRVAFADNPARLAEQLVDEGSE